MIEKNKKTFQIRYGRSASYKTISITCQDQAMRMYEKLVTFAQRHNLQWTVALWCDGWLIQSTRVNQVNPQMLNN